MHSYTEKALHDFNLCTVYLWSTDKKCFKIDYLLKTKNMATSWIISWATSNECKCTFSINQSTAYVFRGLDQRMWLDFGLFAICEKVLTRICFIVGICFFCLFSRWKKVCYSTVGKERGKLFACVSMNLTGRQWRKNTLIFICFFASVFFFVCFVVPVKLGNNKMIYYNKQCCCFGQYFNIQTLQSFIF